MTKDDIKKRIFTNDDISTAKANQISRNAKRNLKKGNMLNARADSMVRRFKT